MIGYFNRSGILLATTAALLCAGAAVAQPSVQSGLLSCDVSAGVGLILTQKQTLKCVFKSAKGGPNDYYTGSIQSFGVALGAVEKGHLIWGVLSATEGFPQGALAGNYIGAGADAAVGGGLGANVLVGGMDRGYALQPVSVEGEVGVNIAGGVTAVTLTPAPAPTMTK
jgi:hypothetical protein